MAKIESLFVLPFGQKKNPAREQLNGLPNGGQAHRYSVAGAIQKKAAR